MKKFFLYSAVALLLAACSGQSGYQISGTVSDPAMEGKYVYLQAYPYAPDDTAQIDSALVTGGKFEFKGSVTNPSLRVLVSTSDRTLGTMQSAVFVLGNAKLTAVMDTLSYVNGTPENDSLTILLKKTFQLDNEMSAFAESHQDSADQKLVEQKYDEIDSLTNVERKAYLAAHPNQLSSAFVFYQSRYSLSEEEQEAVLAKATPEFRAVPGIDKMIEHLNIRKTVAIGKKFTDIELADPTGKMIKLSDYAGKGKVVLLDFWASWCPPCRAEMPNIVAAYAQYKSKGLEVVGVSLDSKADAWAQGLKDLKMTWPQMSDLQGWKNQGAALYGVNSIPHSVLIDGEGTIIAKDLRGEALQAELAKVLK